jgi:hypothetical protein
LICKEVVITSIALSWPNTLFCIFL